MGGLLIGVWMLPPKKSYHKIVPLASRDEDFPVGHLDRGPHPLVFLRTPALPQGHRQVRQRDKQQVAGSGWTPR